MPHPTTQSESEKLEDFSLSYKDSKTFLNGRSVNNDTTICLFQHIIVTEI